MIPICQEVAKPHIFTSLWWIGRVSLQDLYKEFLECSRPFKVSTTKHKSSLPKGDWQKPNNQTAPTQESESYTQQCPSYAIFQVSKLPALVHLINQSRASHTTPCGCTVFLGGHSANRSLGWGNWANHKTCSNPHVAKTTKLLSSLHH